MPPREASVSEAGEFIAPLPSQAAQPSRAGQPTQLRDPMDLQGKRLAARWGQPAVSCPIAVGSDLPAPGSGGPRAPFLDTALVLEHGACRHDSAVAKYSCWLRECSGEQLLNEHKLLFFWEAADALHTIQIEIYTGRLQFASTRSHAVYILCNYTVVKIAR